MICYDGKLSIYCFSGSACIVSLLYLPNVIYDYVPKVWGAMFWGPLLYYVIINICLKLLFYGNAFQIAARATLLGYLFSMGVFIWALCSPGARIFGAYMCVMAVFHYTEFLAIAITNPATLSVDSFVLNHSREYTIAAISSWIEFGVEYYFFPELKTYEWISIIGFIVCVCGELLRKIAMLTAKSNFNHLVQNTKAEDHVLITHGVYKLFRHPSYVGWFYWSIGTQVLLINPFCIIAYTLVSWLFFKERILHEEITLLYFFGNQYYEYKKKVPTGLPFINGYRVEL